jgi:hypothetical protein
MYFVAAVSNSSGCPIANLNGTNLMRRETNGLLTFIAGSATAGNTGDGLTGANTRIQTVGHLHLDAAGDIIYVEQNTHRIRKIVGAGAVAPTTAPPQALHPGAQGLTVTLLGQNGVIGFGTLTAPGGALLSTPGGMIVDPVSGDLYWTEDGSDAVRLLIP